MSPTKNTFQENTPNVNLVYMGTSQTIVAKRQTKLVQLSQFSVSQANIQKAAVRSTFSDPFAGIKTLPGVVKNGGFDTRMYVRGGASNELTIVMDDYYLFSPYFFGGMVSVINSNLVNNIDLYSSNFPGKYGQALSGIIDVTTQRGSVTNNRTELNQSCTDINYIFEGPIEQNNSSWLISVKRTYYDFIFKLMMPDVIMVPFYEALEGQTYFKIAPGQNLAIHYALFHEKGDINLKQSLFEDNIFQFDSTRPLMHLNWSAQWDETLSTKLMIGGDRLQGYYKQFSQPNLDVNYTYTLLQSAGELTYTGLNEHQLTTGIFYLPSKQNTDIIYTILSDPNYTESITTNHTESINYNSNYFATYVQDEFQIIPNSFTMIGSIRYEQLFNTNLSKSKSLQPRLTLVLGNRAKSAFLLSAGQYFQFNLHTFNSQLQDLYPEKATHYTAGYQMTLKDIFFRMEGFYKDYNPMVLEENNSQTGLLTGYNNDGLGRAGGIELFLQKKENDSWDGWFTYTYSIVQYKEPGKFWYYPSHDQRHTANLVGNFQIIPKLKLCTTLEIASGKPYTNVLEATYDATRSIWIPQKGDKNGNRYPASAKLDLWLEYLAPAWPLSLLSNQGKMYFGFSDVFNTGPILGASWNENYTERTTMKAPRYPIFGTQVIF